MSLTKDGRSLLESHRDHDHERSQTFYAGLGRERELEHDLQVYRAYEQAQARLLEHGAHIERVLLDHELKSEYQRWLHERDKDYDDYDCGRLAHRRFALPRFPYTIVYRVREQDVYIVAIAHNSRRPNYWKNRR